MPSLSLSLPCEDPEEGFTHQTLEPNRADLLISGSPASRTSKSEEIEHGSLLHGEVPMWEHQEGLPWPSTG